MMLLSYPLSYNYEIINYFDQLYTLLWHEDPDQHLMTNYVEICGHLHRKFVKLSNEAIYPPPFSSPSLKTFGSLLSSYMICIRV